MNKYIFITDILPFIFIWLIWITAYRSKLQWILRCFFLLLFIGLIFLSPLKIFVNQYIGWGIWITFIVSAIRSFLKIKKLPFASKADWWEALFGTLIIGAIIFILNYPPPKQEPASSAQKINLTFPLRSGSYYLTNVGFSPSIGGFPTVHSSLAEKFAIDIMRPRNLKEFFSSFFKADLGQYAIFGDDIHSPCDGFIDKANDDLPDLIPPAKGTGTGNHIYLNCNGTTILLAHLHNKSIRFKEGQGVTTDDVIAQVGNNGNSTEPHLHINAYITRGENNPVETSQIMFDGKIAKRGSIIEYGQ
ncbi:MAG: M23 family metallopeptidase [Candidatus Magasanikbacteria bacterium]|nr:M23 family metallopeptidase [Candidatus Magasanikbacteria bacterium]